MNWIATITEKTFTKGRLMLTITYSKGTQTFNETSQVFNVGEVNNKIKNRLDELARLDAAFSEIPDGVFIPAPDTPPEVDEKAEAYRKVFQAKEELAAKLITQEEFDQVVADYKALEK